MTNASTTSEPAPPAVCVVAYAAKSTDEGSKGSLENQLGAIREAVAKEGGREIVLEERDNDASAFHATGLDGVRGDGMVRAYSKARELAASGRTVEVWVFKSDRLARGDGRGSQHLTQHVLAARQGGYGLRSVTDDMAVSNLAFAGMVGDQNHGESQALSDRVTLAKARDRRSGKKVGGPVPDGYLKVTEKDANGEPIPGSAKLILDPTRSPVILEMFALSELGHGDPTVARRLAAAGHRTARGNPWDRRSVQSILINPIYGGLHRRRLLDGEWEFYEATDISEAMMPLERWRAITSKRTDRDRSAKGRKTSDQLKGKSTTHFALARLARCARCGSAMYAKKHPTPRADGSFYRYYICRHNNDGGIECDQPTINAEAVDVAVVAHLRDYFADFGKWAGTLRDASTRDATVVRAQITRLENELAAMERTGSKGKAKWAEFTAQGDDVRADLAMEALVQATERVSGVTVELEAARARLAELEARAEPTDSMLHYWTRLAESVWGRITASSPMGEINMELRAALSHVTLDTVGETISIEPFQRLSGAAFAPVTTSKDRPKRIDADGVEFEDWGKVEDRKTKDWLKGLPETVRTDVVANVAKWRAHGSARRDHVQEVKSNWEPWHWGFVAGCGT